MDTHPRPPVRRPVVVALPMLALLLPLLAACGGSVPESTFQRYSAGVSAPQSNGAPAALPPADTGAAAGGDSASAAEAPAIADSGSAAPKPASGSGTTAMEPAYAPSSGDAAGAIAAQPTPEPPARGQGQQQYTSLKAGEVDDNADFAAYLDYLSRYYGSPITTADVRERYILTVVNDRQQPVLDARVRLFDGERQVFEGRTLAGGKTIVHPALLDISGNTTRLRVRIEKGNAVTEGTLERGQDGAQRFVLPAAEALPKQPRLDVLFLLDATGSMGDEIAQIQNTIVSIADRIDQFQPRPDLRFGLVAYRDHGDEFLTRVYNFTPDVASFRSSLLNIQAGGGGDTPEALDEGLHAAIHEVGWASDAVRLIFLVADAPPHLDDQQGYNHVEEASAAVVAGIKIHTIAASNSDDQAEYVFRQLAQQTLGHFIFLTYQPGQNAGSPGDTTTHHVDPQAFTVERLDELVVQLVRRELTEALGTG